MSPSPSCCSRTRIASVCWRPTSRSTTARPRRISIRRPRRPSSSRSASTRATSTPDWRAADLVVEGEYRLGHQEQLYIEPNGVIAVPDDDGPGMTRVRLVAVPVLRASRADGAAGPAGRQGPRRPDRDRRRLRRQRGVSVDDCRARGAARLEGAAPGEACLRPRRGHAGDDQAPPGDHPPSNRRDARRPADGRRYRRAVRRRCLRHAERGRALARASFTRPAPTAATTSAFAAES